MNERIHPRVENNFSLVEVIEKRETFFDSSVEEKRRKITQISTPMQVPRPIDVLTPTSTNTYIYMFLDQ